LEIEVVFVYEPSIVVVQRVFLGSFFLSCHFVDEGKSISGVVLNCFLHHLEDLVQSDHQRVTGNSSCVVSSSLVSIIIERLTLIIVSCPFCEAGLCASVEDRRSQRGCRLDASQIVYCVLSFHLLDSILEGVRVGDLSFLEVQSQYSDHVIKTSN